MKTWSMGMFLRGAALCVPVLLLCACMAEGNPVSMRGIVRDPPIGPEGTWHDLENVVAAGRGVDVPSFFSRRYILRAIGEEKSLEDYKRDYEAYEIQLGRLDQRLLNKQKETAEFGERVTMRLRAMMEHGEFITLAGSVGIVYRDEREYARGPNTGSMALRYWPEGVGKGTPEEWRVRFVQEFDFWKIDGVEREENKIDPFARETP